LLINAELLTTLNVRDI